MTEHDNDHSRTTRAVGSLLSTLQERAKELSCLYAVEEVLFDPNRSLGDIFKMVVEVIPPGWQYSDICQAQISHNEETYQTTGFKETQWTQCADIYAGESLSGRLLVSYNEDRPPADDGPFLKEESKLIETIADRLGHFILHQQTREMFRVLSRTPQRNNGGDRGEWRLALDLMWQTDPNLFGRIIRKMMNHLCWRGVDEAESLLARYGGGMWTDGVIGETNQPLKKTDTEGLVSLGEEAFRIATLYLSDLEILASIKKWIGEDKSGFLVRSLVNAHAPLSTITDALMKYQHLVHDKSELPRSALASACVSLTRRFFTDQLEFINIAKNHVEIEDFFELVGRMVSPAGSNGKLGGKSAGLFLANKILQNNNHHTGDLGEIRVPKTWYVASDGLLEFVRFNAIEDVHEQKYKTVEEVRQEYPHLVKVFKNLHFPQEMKKGLSMALDDFGDVPLIVRSSSLLEDRLGSAFSGKYKSLFLANQGDKEARLEALMDAIAEVYASTFGPDPIEYRAERGLLDFFEEMGIMIQEVVGTRAGNYFLPSFAGVSFSNNEFRWSSRIRREDGLVRIVPGLGTRAVDRLTDDYPVLAAPGQPRLRVNASFEDMVRYSPKYLDVIDLVNNKFQTMEFSSIIRDLGNEFPQIEQIVSVYSDDRLKAPNALTTDYREDDIVITFEGLFRNTPFLKQMRAILQTLEESMGTPVDIEFASVGNVLYLLQCRPQSHSMDVESAQIPKHIPPENLLFSANKYISNGRIPDITHVVYVSPDEYGKLEDHSSLVSVGMAIGQLNKLLPKRQFVLMGPGRWGSRGDIKLGIRVTYSDINNTAVLIEIARKKGAYVPDLSFGTHFFQDLVEASIRYLPLYPDDKGISFNEDFLSNSPNLLKNILPQFGDLEKVIKVIDIQKVTDGKILRILMNAAREEAVGILCPPESPVAYEDESMESRGLEIEDHWKWRHRMAERIGATLDAQRYGVDGIYLFGSTKNATAGPASDVDLLIHFSGNEQQRRELEHWLEGWSNCLDELNYLKTGSRSDGLLDVHIITDEDIEKRSSFAIKIGAVTDAALQLPLKKE